MSHFMPTLRPNLPLAVLAVLLLSACKPATDPTPEPTLASEPSSDEVSLSESQEAEPVSILRPDVEAETQAREAEPIKSAKATIGFPKGGSELDGDAIAALEQLVGSDQFAQSGAIILRAHSDSAGSDAANERASEARGIAVAQWLIEAGADPRRIDVIVFGEQNPIEPNALPDGSPNEEGRAANRRVEVEILAPSNADADGSEPGDEA